jgi:hypothetical protein
MRSISGTRTRPRLPLPRLLPWVFLMAFACCLPEISQAHAGRSAPDDHDRYCSCGPKCRRASCCCRPESTDVPADESDDVERQSDETDRPVPNCAMTAPCGDSADVSSSPKVRIGSRPDASHHFVGMARDSMQELLWVVDSLCDSVITLRRLERPPRTPQSV